MLVAVGRGVGVNVRVGNGVSDGVNVLVGVGGVTPGGRVWVGSGVAVRVGIDVRVKVAVEVGIGVKVSVGVGVGCGTRTEQALVNEKTKMQASKASAVLIMANSYCPSVHRRAKTGAPLYAFRL